MYFRIYHYGCLNQACMLMLFLLRHDLWYCQIKKHTNILKTLTVCFRIVILNVQQIYENGLLIPNLNRFC